MRRRLEREAPERLQVKMWLFPYLTIFSILAIVAVLVSMYFTKGGRPQLLATLASIAVIIVAYFIRRAVGPPETPPDEVIRR